MRIKESLQLDGMIRERAASLAMEPRHDMLIKKAKCLELLIKCQEELDDVMSGNEPIEPPTPNINVNISPGRPGSSGPTKVPYLPFDGGDIARELKKALFGNRPGGHWTPSTIGRRGQKDG